MTRTDILIIGAGSVGSAIAYTLSRYASVTAVLERNPDVAMGTSGKNSAVVHAGFNNRPGSLMARLCVEGNKNFESACETLDVPYRKCGKLVVALNDGDLAIVDSILADGKANGCVGLEKIDGRRLKELEPNARGVGALYSGNTAVFDPFRYNIHLAEAARQNGVSFHFNNEVVNLNKKDNDFIVTTTQNTFTCNTIINAAGLYSDKVAAMAGDDSFTIYPCRGEYYILDTAASELVSRPVYPAPRKGVGGLGVHLTTTIDGNVIIGPNAEYIGDKDDYATDNKSLDDLWNEAKQLLPELTRNMIIGQYTGIRSKIVPKGAANFGDFIIEESKKVPGLINLVGIESPGLTASLPIAEMVANIVTSIYRRESTGNVRAGLKSAPAFNPRYTAHPRFAELDDAGRDALIVEDPDYGEVVCRCRNVTKAEVLQALRNPFGARSMVSVKNRVHAGMGRCQGGYCTAKIAEIMMNELHIKPEEIDYRQRGDTPFPGFVK
jgi:glycerol-3-phosphate dehydrogenase